MEIRKTKPEELNILIRMYENACIFMATDPVTSSRTENGKFVYGFRFCFGY